MAFSVIFHRHPIRKKNLFEIRRAVTRIFQRSLFAIILSIIIIGCVKRHQLYFNGLEPSRVLYIRWNDLAHHWEKRKIILSQCRSLFDMFNRFATTPFFWIMRAHLVLNTYASFYFLPTVLLRLCWKFRFPQDPLGWPRDHKFKSRWKVHG